MRGGYGLYISGCRCARCSPSSPAELPFKATFQYNPNSAAQSPDGNNSYLLTHPSSIVAGLNSTNAVDITNPNRFGVGQSITAMSPNLPSTKIQQWNARNRERTRPLAW